MKRPRSQASVAVLALPIEYQLIMELRNGLDMSFEQISMIVMLPSRTVKQLFDKGHRLVMGLMAGTSGQMDAKI